MLRPAPSCASPTTSRPSTPRASRASTRRSSSSTRSAPRRSPRTSPRSTRPSRSPRRPRSRSSTRAGRSLPYSPDGRRTARAGRQRPASTSSGRTRSRRRPRSSSSRPRPTRSRARRGSPTSSTAENYVIAHKLGQVISQSFGATEQTFTSKAQLTALRSAFLAAQKANVTVLGGSGDLGATDYEYNAVGDLPAPRHELAGVGPARHRRRRDEARPRRRRAPRSSPAVAWNDTYARTHPRPQRHRRRALRVLPAPQLPRQRSRRSRAHRGGPGHLDERGVHGARRRLREPRRAPRHGGWRPMCGTSEATPLFAAIVALADQEAGQAARAAQPRALRARGTVASSGLVPVTSGNNTVAFTSGGKTVTVTGFPATRGLQPRDGPRHDRRGQVRACARARVERPAPSSRRQPRSAAYDLPRRRRAVERVEVQPRRARRQAGPRTARSPRGRPRRAPPRARRRAAARGRSTSHCGTDPAERAHPRRSTRPSSRA